MNDAILRSILYVKHPHNKTLGKKVHKFKISSECDFLNMLDLLNLICQELLHQILVYLVFRGIIIWDSLLIIVNSIG